MTSFLWLSPRANCYRGWEDRGVLADFDKIHGLSIIVSDDSLKAHEGNYKKEWDTDADEVIFRNGKKLMLYWRKKVAL